MWAYLRGTNGLLGWLMRVPFIIGRCRGGQTTGQGREVCACACLFAGKRRTAATAAITLSPSPSPPPHTTATTAIITITAVVTKVGKPEERSRSNCALAQFPAGCLSAFIAPLLSHKRVFVGRSPFPDRVSARFQLPHATAFPGGRKRERER